MSGLGGRNPARKDDSDPLVLRWPQHTHLRRVLKVGNTLDRWRLRWASRLVDLANRIVFSADIPSRMVLPPGVFFMHNGLGTVIDEHTTFAGPVLIMQHTTIGYAFGGQPGVPSIGSHVIIGAGATIVGGITIGDNALVAAGAVVTRDVPAGHRAYGNPATIVATDAERVRAFWSEG